MSLKVRITEQAEAELNEIYEWIANESPERAVSWFNGFVEATESLSTNPERCSRALEGGEIDQGIRQLLYDKYRILFIVRDDTVYLLHVRHGARKYLRSEEI